MKTANFLSILLALLPEAEQIASIFIHNPNSQHQFSLIVGTADALAPVIAGLSQVLSAKSAAPFASAAPAAPAEAEPFIPAGVPSAHPAA